MFVIGECCPFGMLTAPVLLEDTDQNLPELSSEWHSELIVRCGVLIAVLLLAFLLSVYLCNFPLDRLSLLTAFPDAEPVSALVSHNLEHVFRRVLVFATLSCAVTLEVVQQRPRLFSDVAEVDRLTALAKKKESIELLE